MSTKEYKVIFILEGEVNQCFYSTEKLAVDLFNHLQGPLLDFAEVRELNDLGHWEALYIKRAVMQNEGNKKVYDLESSEVYNGV